MDVDFGRVERYFADKGFGFISHTFANTGNRHIFFHIKTIKQLDPTAAQVLDREDQAGSIYFWYKYGKAAKGEHVVEALDVSDITECDRLSITRHIQSAYNDIGVALSDEVEAAAEDILGEKDISALVKSRTRLEDEQKALEEKRRRESEAKYNELIEKQAAQRKVEEDEFRGLVAEMSSYGFTQSKQVSNYIVSNQLGYKYPNISGVLEMEMDGRSWNFNGGFPPKVYARLCDELGLSNQGTHARPGKFIPYKFILGR